MKLGGTTVLRRLAVPVRMPRNRSAGSSEIYMASTFYRPLRAPYASTAWKLVMHQGFSIDSAAQLLKISPERVEYMLLAFAKRRAERLAS